MHVSVRSHLDQRDGLALRRVLAEHRGLRTRAALPRLTIEQILAAADAYYAREGRWPDHRSGPVAELPGETWSALYAALQAGTRGLPGGLTLGRLFRQYRGDLFHGVTKAPYRRRPRQAGGDASPPGERGMP